MKEIDNDAFYEYIKQYDPDSEYNFHGHFKSDKYVIMNNGSQNPMRPKVITDLFFRITHRYETRQPLLFQEVTHH